MNFKKNLNKLSNFNLQKGFWRIAIVLTPIWIIAFVPIVSDDWSEPEPAIIALVINPITVYFLMKWIIIPIIKWTLKGFDLDDEL